MGIGWIFSPFRLWIKNDKFDISRVQTQRGGLENEVWISFGGWPADRKSAFATTYNGVGYDLTVEGDGYSFSDNKLTKTYNFSGSTGDDFVLDRFTVSINLDGG